jgi:hypothetical protein
MSKPVNFTYSDTLRTSQQPQVKQKGITDNTGTPMSASSHGMMISFSRPNVNIGHLAPGQTPMNDSYDYNLNFRGPFARPYPIKHWRKQLNTNGRSGRSGAFVDIANRPGGVTFRGYVAPGITCACDPCGNNVFITFDNKFLQSTSKTIKPQKGPALDDTKNNQVENNGFIQVGPVGDVKSYQIQTGVYETRYICYSNERDARRRTRSVTKLSQSYFSTTKQYLKNKCNLFEQKQSINPIQGNDYTNYYIGDRSTQYSTQDCTNPYETGRSCHNVTYYNPSNRGFSHQGAVESSTRTLKLNVNTITKNASSFRSAWGYAASNAGKYQGESFSPYFIKSKYTLPLAWRHMGNRRNCFKCIGQSQSLSAFWGTGVR